MSQRKKQKTLDSFFGRQPVPSSSSAPILSDVSVTSELSAPTSASAETHPASSTSAPFTESEASQYDIGLYKVGGRLSDADKYSIVSNVWKPLPGYIFPHDRPTKSHRRSFQPKWMTDFSWLVYSKISEGGYCIACVIFGKSVEGNEKLGVLVSTPLTNWQKALELLKKHAGRQYHLNNVAAMHNFKSSMEGKAHSVQSQIDSAMKKRVEENRRRLIPIIKTIILCGRRNIPLRGHRDDGPFSGRGTRDEDNYEDGGNFRSLLEFRVDAGDEILRNHLETASKNATYISKTVQNELIECCRKVMISKIIQQVKESKYFTIIADETTDISVIEQMSLCLRYVDLKKVEIKERFIKFIQVDDLTGGNLSKVLLDEIGKLGLDVANCRGQAYDGCANMKGHISGVQARISTIQPLAIYTHCVSHRLNLVLVSSATVTGIRNAMGIITKCANYIRESAQRMAELQRTMGENYKRIMKLCVTRWVERHAAVLRFVEILPYLPDVLEDLKEKERPGLNGSAFSLQSAIRSSEFIVSVLVLNKMFGITLPLS